MKKIPDNCAVVISVTSDSKYTYHCVLSESLQGLVGEGAWHFFQDDFQYLHSVGCVGCILTVTDVRNEPIRIGDLIMPCEDELSTGIYDVFDDFRNGYYSEEISNILKEYKVDELK